MKHFTGLSGGFFAAAAVLTLGAVFIFGGNATFAAGAPVGLGRADSAAVLAGTAVTNTGSSVVSGDVGVSPGSSISGFPPGIVTNGVIHTTDAVAATAQTDLTTAYNDAAARSATSSGLTDLSGMTLGAGVYSGGALGLTGTLTLTGDASSVFIFQAASTLITGSASRVLLTGGATACNVFWQVGSSATLGPGSVFVGTVMALTSITADTAATIQGRLLARNGAVTLDTNTVTRPTSCSPTSTVTPTPTTPPASTPTPTPPTPPASTPTPTPQASTPTPIPPASPPVPSARTSTPPVAPPAQAVPGSASFTG